MIGQKKKVDPGFIVADVLLNQDVTLQQLKPFLKKVTMMRAQPKSSPFLAIFIANRYTREAFEAGRRAGIVVATVDNLFGREVAAAITDLIGVLTNAAAAITADPSLIEKLFSRLDAIKGADLNVKGALFELLVARALNSDGYNIDAMNEAVRSFEGMTDIDVLARKGNELLAIECKGFQKNLICLNDAKRWCEKTIPWTNSQLKTQKLYKDKKMAFEFWAATGFTPEAEEYLTGRASSTGKYEIRWKGHLEIEREMKRIGDQYVLKVWRSHYDPKLTTLAAISSQSHSGIQLAPNK